MKGRWMPVVVLAVACAGLATGLAVETLVIGAYEVELLTEPNPYAPGTGTKVDYGSRVTWDGKTEGDMIFVTANGTSGWIAKGETHSVAEYDKLMGEAGKSSEEIGAESSSGRGFDPEVEDEFRKANPDIDKIYKTLVLPWIYETRGSEQLETLDDKYGYHVLRSEWTEAKALLPGIERAKQDNQKFVDAQNDADKTFRKAGRTGEFAGRK